LIIDWYWLADLWYYYLALAFQLERHYWLHFISLRHFHISSFSTFTDISTFSSFFIDYDIFIISLYFFHAHFDIDIIFFSCHYDISILIDHYCHYITLLIFSHWHYFTYWLFHYILIFSLDTLTLISLLRHYWYFHYWLLITHIDIIFSLYFSIDIILADTLLLTY
jgi:hypothetical protein